MIFGQGMYEAAGWGHVNVGDVRLKYCCVPRCIFSFILFCCRQVQRSLTQLEGTLATGEQGLIDGTDEVECMAVTTSFWRHESGWCFETSDTFFVEEWKFCSASNGSDDFSFYCHSIAKCSLIPIL